MQKVYDHSTHSSVNFMLHLSKENMITEDKLIIEIFKLESKISTKNMTLYAKDGRIKRYSSTKQSKYKSLSVLLLFST